MSMLKRTIAVLAAVLLAACSAETTAPTQAVTKEARAVTTSATLVSTSVEPASATLCVGDRQEFQLVNTYDDGSTQVVKVYSWSVGSPTVLNLRNHKSGNVTATSLGTSSVVAQYSVGIFFVAIATVNC
jgi:hypothetical protein